MSRRVRVSEYGSLPSDSPLLVPVPTVPGKTQQRMHVLAARALGEMASAVLLDLGVELLAASGWLPRRWASRAEYESVLVERYGSVARGMVYLAYDSPHETGLAVDLECGGLSPTSATIAAQRQVPLWRWLASRAAEHGFYPHEPEPWHWEYPVDVESYRRGS